MGHLLPFDSILAEDAEVRGLGSPDAWFQALPDPETNFTLFAAAGGGGSDGLVARLRPDEDVCVAIAALCAEHRIPRARVHGLGSIAEPRFADGRHVPCVATEVRIDAGRVTDGVVPSTPRSSTSRARSTPAGSRPASNPVGVTFELLIEALP